MIEDSGDLGEQHPNVLRAGRRSDSHQLFDRERESVLLAHRRYVVEPVEIRYCLQVGLVLDQLFGAAVQQTDMRVGTLDDLSIHLEDEPHDAVCRRMLRPEIHHVVLDPRRPLELARQWRPRVAHLPPSFGVSPTGGMAFSSPGSILSMPSHGDKKSKLRNSCG